jgi:2-methylcitrate dehydratase
LKSRVLTVHDPEMDERKKMTKAHSAEVDVETKDGHKFSERVDYPPGDPGNPASQEDIERKVRHYASKVLGQDRTQSLIETVKNLESVSDLNELGKMLRIN